MKGDKQADALPICVPHTYIKMREMDSSVVQTSWATHTHTLQKGMYAQAIYTTYTSPTQHLKQKPDVPFPACERRQL